MSAPELGAELRAGTAHGAVYLRRLRRAHLALAWVSLVAFGGLVGALPLVLLLAPGLARTQIAGVPISLALVIVAPFPVFVAIGWLHERRADALDHSFAGIVAGDDKQ
jgi:hypothetical protein